MTRPIVAAITVDSVRANGSDEGLRGQSYDAGEYGEGPQAPYAQAATTRPSAVGARVNPNIRHNPVTQRHRAMVDRGLVLQRQLSERIAAESDAILGDADEQDVADLLDSLAALRAGLR